MNGKVIDLVICGPDMSGKSNQVQDIANHLACQDLIVRDLRGNELDALFHAHRFSKFNREYRSRRQFQQDPEIHRELKRSYLEAADEQLSKGRVASMRRNGITEYIDPLSAHVWILEEPPERGAGQTSRIIEHNRSSFKSTDNQISAALAHQAYRTDEYLRFRGPLRKAGRIVVRSRSEESACYQVRDEDFNPNGVRLGVYLSLPGHEIAFKNPPTHLMVVCGPEEWTRDQYIKFRKERGNGRRLDDYEKDVDYQLMINRRYATSWLDELYEQGCDLYGSKKPKIYRFSVLEDRLSRTQKMLDIVDSL